MTKTFTPSRPIWCAGCGDFGVLHALIGGFEDLGGIENDLKEITNKLRCMTCQNQTIYDSDAEFSQDIKKLVKKMFIEGKNQKEIMEFLKS